MIDTPMQEVAQHEPCRSCSAALGAAVSMAKLVLRFEAGKYFFLFGVQH
jgi:hypothetical protein